MDVLNVFNPISLFKKQGVDGSARSLAFVLETDYMAEKTYHLALYLDSFGAYLIKVVSI